MIAQIGIALTGAVAIWLTQQSNESLKKYACLFGVAGQPFWFYSAYQAEQWGIFVMCFFYAYSWLIGVRAYWGTRIKIIVRRKRFRWLRG